MMKITGKFFQGETIVLDGHHFDNCDFDGCTIVFNGESLFGLTDCRFYEPNFVFDKYALNSLQALSIFYNEMGMKEFIENTFENIRRRR